MEGLCLRGPTRGERRPTRFLDSLPFPAAGPHHGRLLPRPSSKRFTGASAAARRGVSMDTSKEKLESSATMGLLSV